MRAKVLIDFNSMKGNAYPITEVIGSHVTLKVPSKYTDANCFMQFTLNELEVLCEGSYVEVYRNQNYRDGQWIGFNPAKGYYLKYTMPNGKEYINVCKNPFNTDEYKSVPAQKVLINNQ